MTQRKNAHNHSQSAWQRSLPAQSLCWLGSFSLLSSGFVVAQTTSGIDNIVPTAKSSQARNSKKVTQNKPIVISVTPKPESPKPKVDFSERRAKLKQRLSVKKSTPSSAKKPVPKVVTTNKKAAATLRTRLKRSRTNSVVVKLKKQAPTTSPRVVIKKKPTLTKPTASKVRVSSPKKTQTILPKINTVRTQKDYNNALIDPTNYGKKYQAPNSVVITGRKSGCQSVVSGQGISGNCTAQSGQVSSQKTPAKKTTPNWLKASQNATIASGTTFKKCCSED